MPETPDKPAIIVWMQMLGLLALVALFGLIVTWLSRKAHGG